MGPNEVPRPPMWPGLLEAAIELRAASVAEVCNRGGAANTLDPDVLDSGDVRCKVVGGDDHLRGERFVVTVTGPVEVCEQNDGVLAGGCGLQQLRRRPGALEGCASAELDRIPANTLARETPGKWALENVARASEATRGLDGARHRVVRPAARECRGTTGEAADVPCVEAEAGLAVACCQC